MYQNRKLEYIGNGINILTSKDYGFSMDSLILAYFASPKPNYNIVEIGSGCGIISFVFCRDSIADHITAIEIQSSACEIMRQSIKINFLQDKITVINDDINNNIPKLKYESYDMAVCNPPYKNVGSGGINKLNSKRTARHETSCTIDEITKASKKLLKNGGTLCLCHRAERLCDILSSMRKNRIEPKILRFVHYKEESPSKLFLIKGKKGAKPGINCMPPLIVTNKDNSYSSEMNNIYKYIKTYERK